MDIAGSFHRGFRRRKQKFYGIVDMHLVSTVAALTALAVIITLAIRGG